MKKRLPKYLFSLLLVLVIGCLINCGNSFGQTNTLEDFERATSVFTGSSPVLWSTTQSVAGYTTTTSPFTNGGSKALTFNRPASGTTTPTMSGQIAGTGFSIGSNTWEWTFLYQAPASVTPADNNGAAVTGDDWRFWVNASGTDPTVGSFKGYYVTQDGTSLKLYYFCNGCGGRSAVGTFAVTAGSQYIVRVVHDTGGGGEWQFYVTAYTSSTSFPTTSLGATFDQLSGTYTTSFFQTSLSSSANNGIFLWDNLYMYKEAATITGYNAAANGITPGSIAYGQTGIVLFGFGVTALGTFAINQIQIPASVSVNPYFTNAKLYKSSDQYFADATLISGTTTSFPSNYVSISGLTENIVNTTEYYFLVADFTASTSFNAPATIQFNFASGSTSIIQSSPFTTYTNYSTTNGNTFNVVLTYNWVGGTSTDFSDGTNFKTLLNGGAGVPGINIAVRIGGVAYTHAPSILSSTTIGGLTFGATGTPTLTIASTKTLTINNAVNAVPSSNATITGPGTLTIASTAISNMASASTLNLTGGVTANNAGSFTMSPQSVLNINNSTVANTGTFTLASDATGSANIGQLVGTGNLTGNYTVQRFVTGGSASLYRGYRNMSSPISSTGTTGGLVDLSYIPASTFVTGAVTSPSCTLCTVGGNPSLYLYREDLPVINTSFVSGNFVGVTDINGTALKTTNGTPPVAGTATLPAGNGFYLFFRGDRTTNITNKTTTPFAAADNVTFSTSGKLNQGQIIVKDWFNQASSNLSFTAATAATAKGFNLVGNPYPSSIDWNKAFSGTALSGIYAPNTDQTVYIYNTTTKNYSAYQNTSSSTGTASGSAGGSNIIPSGQGFFVHATSAAAQLIFNEDAKVSSQPATLLLNATLPGSIPLDQHLRLQLIKDSVNIDESVIVFNDNSSTKYVPTEDALYLKGSGIVSLSNMSSDRIALAINHLPLPKLSPTTVPLNVSVTSNGVYTLNLSEATNIPALYDIWLMDAYSKDSLDIKHNPTYNFNISADTASSSAKRFTLVIRQNTANAYHLLSFNGSKVTGGSQLTWTTENEENYTTFTVERSANGSTFTALDVEPANGSGSYSYLDQNPVAGLDQYRLKQVDVNGTITYSNVVQLQYSNLSNAQLSNGNINIFPNPVKDNINLNITTTNGAATTYSINITNSSGYIVKTFTSQQTVWQNNISDLTPGMYVIKVINNTDNTIVGTNKFIKL